MRKAIRYLIRNQFAWAVISFFIKISGRFKFEKELISIELNHKKQLLHENRIKEKFNSLTVLNGLFKGMKYPEFYSAGSSLYAKLIGSYESELSGCLTDLFLNNYSEIIDVGCAEGYYAIGMAIKNPNARIFAYDIDSEAIIAAKKMAEINSVSSQLTFNSICTSETLSDFSFTGKGLVLSDCEGFEIELFTQQSVKNLKNCDVLIELHDLYNELITPSLENVFKESHDVKYIYSENTFVKLTNLGLKGDLSDSDIKSFFLERNGIMQWALYTPKKREED